MDESHVPAAPTGDDMTTLLAADRHAVAPDGSDVRVLLRIAEHGSMAHFELAPGETSVPIRHRTVSEIWYVLGGRGAMWRRDAASGGGETELRAGTCLTNPLGTEFQFRCFGHEPLQAIGVTMPPWPLADDPGEPIRATEHWVPTVAPGPGLVAE
jgi:mannose-6-phosphate isomerase-like protein (cupin superfamily)